MTLVENGARSMGFTDEEFAQYHDQRNAEFLQAEASVGPIRGSLHENGDWSAWISRYESTASPSLSRAPPSTGLPMGGSSIAMGFPAAGSSTVPGLPVAGSSKPRYTPADLRQYMRSMVDQSENIDDFFGDLQIDAGPVGCEFIRHVRTGRTKGDLDALVSVFKAIRQNPSSEYVFL